MMKILFVCTGNSCRSILAEAIFNSLAPSRTYAMSAGSHPTGQVHKKALELLKEKGISTDGLYSKSWNDLEIVPDVVITVCDNAAGEACPAYLGPATRAHWGVADPAKVSGTDDEIDQAFEQSYKILRTRIESFFNLGLERLDPKDEKLKIQLDSISHLV